VGCVPCEEWWKSLGCSVPTQHINNIKILYTSSSFRLTCACKGLCIYTRRRGAARPDETYSWSQVVPCML